MALGSAPESYSDPLRTGYCAFNDAWFVHLSRGLWLPGLLGRRGWALDDGLRISFLGSLSYSSCTLKHGGLAARLWIRYGHTRIR